MSFGSRIKIARENKRYSQQQLADLMKVTDGTISNYEKGVAFPRWDTIKTICDLLDVDPNYLFWDDLTEDIKNKILDENNSKKYKKLFIEDKQKVDTYIDDLLATSKYQHNSEDIQSYKLAAASGNGIEKWDEIIDDEKLRKEYEEIED